MALNAIGGIIDGSWQWLEKQYEYVELDEFIVMPNHVHGIVFINNAKNNNNQGGSRTAPTKHKSWERLIGGL